MQGFKTLHRGELLITITKSNRSQQRTIVAKFMLEDMKRFQIACTDAVNKIFQIPIRRS